MIDLEFFEQLDRFTLMVRKRVSSAYIGARRSVKYGRGAEPVGYREYNRGDDIRLIDWKVYARTERLFVREHEEERNITAHILLDVSRSMGYGEPTKLEYGLMVGAGVAYLMCKQSSSTGSWWVRAWHTSCASRTSSLPFPRSRMGLS